MLLPNRNPDDIEEIRFVLESIAPADGIIFTYFAPEPSYVGLSIANIAVLRGTSEAQTLSDVIRGSIEWTEADGGFTGHPRVHGAFPRVLARYVRDHSAMPLEEAIAAMTQRAAKAIGIADRSLLAAGMKADLVLLDPDTAQDHATV